MITARYRLRAVTDYCTLRREISRAGPHWKALSHARFAPETRPFPAPFRRHSRGLGIKIGEYLNYPTSRASSLSHT